MSDESQSRLNPGERPVVEHPGPSNIEDLLRYVDRRASAENPARE